ncbi:MAG: NAD-binding protein [Halobacteria archaeon]|nr:NAD-binding protein [Halobacteria archaeon]
MRVPIELTKRRKRGIIYVGTFVSLILAYTVVYDWGMSVYEGRPRSFINSLQIVIQTFTTTGYGEDAPWNTPQMTVLMIAMQFTGIILIFMALPVFVVPWIQDAIRTAVPDSVGEMRDHVVICGYTSLGETLVEELESRDIGYVIVEPNRGTATELYEDDLSVIHGDPGTTETLERANVGSARAVIINSSDERSATIVLSVREVNKEVRIVSLVEDPSITKYLKYAGADHVISPRHLLGRSLADKAATAVSTRLGGTVELGEDFEIVELPVQKGCEIEGKKLSESRIRERTGASVIGAWIDGEFISSPPADTRIDDNAVLLVTGKESQLEKLKEMTLSEGRIHPTQKVLVAGYGEVGSTVEKELRSSGVPKTVIDIEDKEGVDIVGDVTEEETLIEAGIDDASALIVALSDDTSAVFTTLVAQELNPQVEIIVRANDTDNMGKLYRAGADYVLALANVSGRMLAYDILEEDVITPDKQIKMVRTQAPELVDRTLKDANIRLDTGCIVVAVERNGDILTDLGPNFVIQEEDEVIVAGTDEDINRFNSTFGTG